MVKKQLVMTRIKIQDTSELRRAALQFLHTIGEKRVIAFYGKMGAGKTTFISALCDLLQVEDAVASPTFAIVNEYRAGLLNALQDAPSEQDGEPCLTEQDKELLAQFASQSIFHFDFYRIRNLGEAQDIGIDDYFYSGQLCLIEWPELIEPLLPEDSVVVRLTEEADGSRLLEVE